MPIENPSLPASRITRHVSIIMLLALAARVAVFTYAWQNFARFDFPDSHRYIAVARNILAGNGPIDSAEVLSGTDPVYPCLISLGGMLGITSDRGLLIWARAIASLLGWLIVPAVALLARRLVGDRTALLAAGWTAIDPMILFFGATALTELPFTALLAWACVALLKGVREGKVGWMCVAGFLFALGTLTRSTALFLPLTLLPFILLRLRRQALIHRRGLARQSLLVMMLMLTYIATLLPLVWRQHRVLGEWRLPTRTGGGASLLEALGPWADGGPGMDRIIYPPTSPGADELERDRVYRQHAIQWAGANRGRTVELAWAKLKRTWSVSINAAEYRSPLYAVVAWLTVAPIFALAGIGLWIDRRRIEVVLLLLAPAAYFTLVHMVFVGSIRYRLPAMPLVFILAALGATHFLRKRNGTTEAA